MKTKQANAEDSIIGGVVNVLTNTMEEKNLLRIFYVLIVLSNSIKRL